MLDRWLQMCGATVVGACLVGWGGERLLANERVGSDSAGAQSLPLMDDDPPPHPHGPPPQEAFDACSGKSEGDACSVTIHDQNVDGKCRTPPKETNDTRLFCAPPHPSPPQHP